MLQLVRSPQSSSLTRFLMREKYVRAAAVKYITITYSARFVLFEKGVLRDVQVSGSCIRFVF